MVQVAAEHRFGVPATEVRATAKPEPPRSLTSEYKVTGVHSVDRNPKKYRKKAGFSQEGLALACGLHRIYVSGFERGVRNPTVVVLDQIAKPFGSPTGRSLEEQKMTDPGK